VVVVDVIIKMKSTIAFVLLMNLTALLKKKIIQLLLKKRVLENTDVIVINKDGAHSPVSGGIGSEKLTDLASNIVVAVPINDDVLTIDVGISTIHQRHPVI
jgi:hypothetical protein